jgi:outer membrane protein OmpA-like peptidoglycan-associated protein
MHRSAVVVAVVLATLPATPAIGQNQAPSGKVLDVRGKIEDLTTKITDLQGAVAVEQSRTQVEVTLAADVFFAFDKADLNPDAQAKLTEAADLIKKEAKGTVKIDGYTDAVGNDAYNFDLSNRRAAAVQQALQALVGSASVQFASAGHGKADPLAPNTNPDGSDNPAGRARNRRVTIAFPK